MGRKLRIIQLAEEDKNELSELGYEALEATQAFLECLDKVTEGQIGEEMKRQYGTRRGVPGSGRGRYGRRGDGGSMGSRRGVAGTGRYGRRHDDDDEDEDYDEEYGSRGGGYGNRYDW